jgi:hypothetical protein
VHLERPNVVGEFLALMGCNAIVFVTSVCLMVIELTATRLIAAHLGNSLYTWTSVIGVVLAGIFVGNYIGGWLADQFAPQKVLGWLFLAAGLLTLSVLFVNNWAASAPRPESMNFQWWVMIVVAWIFLLPAVSLGTISPVVASMALKRSTRAGTGMTVGNIYAWGALGSIVGTFLAGFWLIGAYGTREIITITAATLVIMGALVAGGQKALRVALIFGALQSIAVIGVCSSATAARAGKFCQSLHEAGTFWAETRAETQVRQAVADIERANGEDERKRAEEDLAKAVQARAAAERVNREWGDWGAMVGAHLHQLGLTLNLRSDDPDQYNDESDYFEINVGTGRIDGDPIKQLRLDYLLHSYYNPDNPTKLYYDYEKVYAAVTERAAALWQKQTSVSLDPQLAASDFRKALPPGVELSESNRELSIRGGMTFEQLHALLKVGANGRFRDAVLSAWEQVDRDWSGASRGAGGVLLIPLDEPPAGVTFPDESLGRVRFDATLKSLVCTGPFRIDQAFSLIAQGTDGTWARAVIDLFLRSRRTSAMFVGGGGFVFPRWIESHFPLDPHIDVAEIDPAVQLAVEREMGLPSEFGPPAQGKTFVRTHIGDARIFVDERLRENKRLKAANQPIVTYDFAYGDAFNDLSVPWHLTTRQFSQNVRDLLTPNEGVYLVNIIDIYPRAEYPDRTSPSKGDPPPPPLKGDPPAELFPVGGGGWGWISATGGFKSLQMQTTDGGYVLGFRGVMSDATREKLLAIAPSNTEFQNAIRELHTRSQAEKVGQFLGRYVNTAREIFPYVYVISSNETEPGDSRDTFVVACSLKKLDFSDLGSAGGYWRTGAFAWTEPDAAGQPVDLGEMSAILELAREYKLDDNFAPVDNLLAPVFVRRSVD